jgi:hypothetical protein
MKPKAGNSQLQTLSTGLAIALNKIGFTKGKLSFATLRERRVDDPG